MSVRNQEYCSHERVRIRIVPDSKDGVQRICLLCDKVLSEDEETSLRPCPKCEKPGTRVNGWTLKCSECNFEYPEKEEKYQCPMCGKSDRVLKGGVVFTQGKITTEYKCWRCRCEFSRVSYSQTAGYAGYTGTTVTEKKEKEKPRWGARPSTTGCSTSVVQVGRCRKCGETITVYGKSGGYCSVCREHVYPIIPNARPYLLEEDLA